MAVIGTAAWVRRVLSVDAGACGPAPALTVEVKMRTSDEAIYLSENRYRQPKEVHRFTAALARSHGALADGRKILDVGCAAGEFLYTAVAGSPGMLASGFDPVDALIEKARANVPGARFWVGSALDEDAAPGGFDTVFCLGVIGIFDDFRPVFDNLLRWTRPGGHCYVSWMFNDYPIDVWIRYRDANIHALDHREAGWNIFSKKSVSDYLLRKPGITGLSFTPFEIPFDLPVNAGDPARTWTFQDKDGKRITTNGLRLIVTTDILRLSL
jgi:SAM-dependent methyltransferase